MKEKAKKLLRTALNDQNADFRSGQWGCIEALLHKQRMLVVQRTGWGKSMVYFLATRMLRDAGGGFALLISPLLALMRNQIQAAERIGIRAETVNSTNPDDWAAVQKKLLNDEVDVLLISPERLANIDFRENVLAPGNEFAFGRLMDMNMHTKDLTNDAKTILLLCGRFGKNDAAKPFSLREYNRLTDWMLDKKIRPADLLAAEESQILETLPREIDGDRVKWLLGRGAAMALAIDKWTSSGVWVICRSDEDYPVRLKQHLKKQAPAILYGVGHSGLLQRGGLAVVGSRNVDYTGEQFTRLAVAACVKLGIPIVSGGARGVDQVAMLEGLHAGGTVVGVLADSLLRSAIAKKFRDGIREQRLVLVSAFSPDASFNVGNAMGRNKHIYALADFGLIISAEMGKGGTWAGATEELKRPDPRPVFVRDEPTAPEGNRALLKLGAQPYPKPPWGDDLAAKLSEKMNKKRPSTGEQLPMFSQMPLSPLPAVSVKEKRVYYSEDQTGVNGKTTEDDQLSEEVPTSVFDAVLPMLLNALDDWQNPKDLAEKLEVRKPQLDDWLKRAVDEGWIKKKNRPVQYRRLK